MIKLINKLGLNSASNSSGKVWLTSLASFILLGTNYMKLMMPAELFIVLGLGLSAFGFISVLSYLYWTISEWQTINSDKRIGKVFYIGLLLFVTILFSLIPVNLLFR